MSASKTRVNLYSASLLPVEKRLTFHRLVVFSVLFIFVAISLFSIGYWQLKQVKTELAQVSTKKQEYDNQKAQLEAQLAARVPDQQLMKRVKLEQQQLDLKRLLLSELSKRETLTSQGYSLMMTELAQVSDANVWLERIQVENNKYVFEGYSKYPDSVPRWIDKLTLTQTLKGHAFATMSINQGEQKPLAFTLTSTLEALSNAGGQQ